MLGCNSLLQRRLVGQKFTGNISSKVCITLQSPAQNMQSPIDMCFASFFHGFGYGRTSQFQKPCRFDVLLRKYNVAISHGRIGSGPSVHLFS